MSYVQCVKLLAGDLMVMKPSGTVRLAGRMRMSRQAVHKWASGSVADERYAQALLADILESTRGVEDDIHAAVERRLEHRASARTGASHGI